jgi:hypothetical protein
VQLTTGANTIFIDLEIWEGREKRAVYQSELETQLVSVYKQVQDQGGEIVGIVPAEVEDNHPDVIGKSTKRVLIILVIK